LVQSKQPASRLPGNVLLHYAACTRQNALSMLLLIRSTHNLSWLAVMTAWLRLWSACSLKHWQRLSICLEHRLFLSGYPSVCMCVCLSICLAHRPCHCQVHACYAVSNPASRLILGSLHRRHKSEQRGGWLDWAVPRDKRPSHFSMQSASRSSRHAAAE
jgi:hypothetical protein